MNRTWLLVAFALGGCESSQREISGSTTTHAHGAEKAALNATAIGQAVGTDAKTMPDGIVRLSFPRNDVRVSVDSLELHPFAGLSSWAAFVPAPGGAMLMGDTVVFEDEAAPAMDAAFAHGLEVTALHNHFFFDEPHVYFMHIQGMGSEVELGQGVKAVWDAIRDVRRARAQPATNFSSQTPVKGEIDSAAIERIIGYPTEVKDGIVKVTIGREGSMHGVRVGGSMGLTTWAAFSGSDALAAIDGDFIMTASEVQTVLRELRQGGLYVVALHNHMIGEAPVFYFTHFWGKGPAADLARVFRAVLDAQKEVGKP
jgi:hypothetical protein